MSTNHDRSRFGCLSNELKMLIPEGFVTHYDVVSALSTPQQFRSEWLKKEKRSWRLFKDVGRERRPASSVCNQQDSLHWWIWGTKDDAMRMIGCKGKKEKNKKNKDSFHWWIWGTKNDTMRMNGCKGKKEKNKKNKDSFHGGSEEAKTIQCLIIGCKSRKEKKNNRKQEWLPLAF